MRTGPGCSVGDGDARACEFGTQTRGVGAHERLGGRIARLPGERVKSRGGTDVEDRAATARHHLLHGAGAQVDHRLDVDPHLRDLGVDRRFGDRAQSFRCQRC